MLILIIRMNNFKILFQSFSATDDVCQDLGARAQLLLLILIYVKKYLELLINGRARKI